MTRGLSSSGAAVCQSDRPRRSPPTYAVTAVALALALVSLMVLARGDTSTTGRPTMLFLGAIVLCPFLSALLNASRGCPAAFGRDAGLRRERDSRHRLVQRPLAVGKKGRLGAMPAGRGRQGEQLQKAAVADQNLAGKGVCLRQQPGAIDVQNDRIGLRQVDGPRLEIVRIRRKKRPGQRPAPRIFLRRFGPAPCLDRDRRPLQELRRRTNAHGRCFGRRLR